MKILAVGGGSGGHVTPAVAVIKELQQLKPGADIRFWCDRKFSAQAKAKVHGLDPNLKVEVIVAGKLRRYHKMSFWQSLSPSIWLPNIKDAFLVGFGILQSIIKLVYWRPNVIFAKGGYVCLPVGVAAKILNIPLVIHDSDAHPGLTNRILSRWAKVIATGAPLEYYDYPKAKSHFVGIPVASDFYHFSKQDAQKAKQHWGVRPDRPLIVITGGGLGAKRINDTAAGVLDELLELGSVVLMSGAGQYDKLNAITPPNSQDFQLHAFVAKDMALLLGAADVVVARAGATTLAELSALGSNTVLIPNKQLVGGHQIKNASAYADQGAVLILDELDMVKDPSLLVRAVRDVLGDPRRAALMSKAFKKMSRPNAAVDLAKLVLEAA